ncbi:MAG: MerC domain-containing protein [Myxococcota bacterium]
MERVVLLYDRDCPNVRAARSNLLRAFSEAGVPARWEEMDRAGPDTPAAWRGFGSPTVLVDGRDVAGLAPGDGASCRVYESAGARSGAPSVDVIAAALAATPPAPAPSGRQGGVRQLAVAAPGIGVALLPKVACPACWPAYAAVLSSVGLGFLLETRYLLPLTVGFVALASLGWRASRRRGWGPFLLGTTAAAALLVGKFVQGSDVATYASAAVLVAASIWNAWPRGATETSGSCPSCAPNPDAKPMGADRRKSWQSARSRCSARAAPRVRRPSSS